MHSQQTGAADPLPPMHAFYHNTGMEVSEGYCSFFTTLVYNVSPWGFQARRRVCPLLLFALLLV